MRVKLAVVLPIAAGLLAGCQRDVMEPRPAAELAPVFAAVAGGVETNVIVPIDIATFIPCANGGNGEVVTLTGTLHLMYNVTTDNRGGVHVKSHFQPQHVSGVGQITGALYQGTGATQEMYTTKVGFTHTAVNVFRVIGQGPGNNYRVTELTHTTVRPDGTVSASVSRSRVDCG
jgi:hypothetical protein